MQHYDEFQGTTIVVDLDEVDRQTEDFEGREWLEQCLTDEKSWGWDLEWVPDRTKAADNPIALMQFSDENTALLLRCHRSRSWLPSVVIRALESETCKKIGVGWDGPDKIKMGLSFDMLPNGIVDLCLIAERKGLSERGLKSMAEYFGLKPRKDTRVARSNWACRKLSEDQIQYAAEDAYFTFILLEKLLFLPDPTEDNQVSNAPGGAVVTLQPGWEDHGMVRKHDGLWCQLCEKGPMTVAGVVLRHMEGTKHRRKYEQKKTHEYNAAFEMPQNYVDEGIFAGNGYNDVKVGEFKCATCDAGPFASIEVVESHLASRRHQKAVNPEPEPTKEEKEKKPRDKRRGKEREERDEDEEDKGDPHAHMVWNLPDYVHVDEEKDCLVCSLCTASANAVLPMFMHLGGDKHARKCRSTKNDEVLYIKERDRMESLYTGQPIVRSGYRIPRKGDEPYDWRSQAVKDAKRAARRNVDQLLGLQRLPPGWEEFVDEASGGYLFYYHAETNETTWVRPVPVPLTDAERLPPGWQQVWNEEAEQAYFADPETQTSQWEPPTPYFHSDWQRLVDEDHRAYWASTINDTAFYEGDETWQRLLNENDLIYWSDQRTGLRFFEEDPYSQR